MVHKFYSSSQSSQVA